MPTISRAFILTGLLYLAAAMVVAVALALGAAGLGVSPALYPVYIHLLAVGWITQLIFGVAYWMFPGRVREPGATERVTLWSTYVLLNGGLLLRAVAEPLLSRGGAWPAVLTGSAICQLVAVVLFVGHLWPRLRAR